MSAADRLRREGPSVHHILCDLRRPPAGTPRCTCKVPEVAAALADLLDAITAHGHPVVGQLVGNPHPLRVIAAAARALEQAIERSQP